MKILILFLALAIAHYLPAIDRFRAIDALGQGIDRAIERFSNVPMIDLVVLLVVGVVGGGLITALADGLVGNGLWALVALVVLLWGLGPRDLDRDVAHALDEGESEGLGIAPDADAHQAGTQVFLASLTRWFGVIFWFVVLGIPGVLLYRLTEHMSADATADRQRDGIFRLRFFLEWPVLVLMVISAALTNDFDRIYQAWHQYRKSSKLGDEGVDESKFWWIHRGILVDLSEALLPEGLDQRGGIQLAHHFVWRSLILWLVVLSLLLLAGWLS